MFNRFRGRWNLELLFSFELKTLPNKIETWQYFVLGLMIFLSCFYGLSSYPILDMNEGLYAEIAREMLVNKHFIIPHLNNLPYLEKPPLLYYLLALSYQCFGVNAFAARLVPAVFLALTALCVFYVGVREKTHRTGFLSSSILLTSIVFILIGRTVFFDMMLTFFTAASLFSFYFWTQNHQSKDLYSGYIYLGLAILTKGFVVLFLIPLIIGIYLYLTGANKEDCFSFLNKKALVIFCFIVLPWHILAILSFPPFFWEYFVNNQLFRFFNIRIPHDYHTGPIYFYLPRAIAYLLPWTIYLPAICWPLSFKKPWNPLKVFLITWFLVMLVFFSLSGDKGDYYLVIGIVPLAYLLAQKIEVWIETNNAKWLWFGFYSLASILVVSSIVVMIFYTSHDPRHIIAPQFVPFVLNHSLLLLTLELAVYSAAGFYFSRKNRSSSLWAFLWIAGFVAPILLFYLDVREATQGVYSQKTLAKYVSAQYTNRPIYYYRDFETLSSFVFYNKEPAIMIDSKSADLYFGQHHPLSKEQFITMQDFIREASQKSVYVLMEASQLKNFQEMLGDANKNNFCVVQGNAKVVMLSNANEDCRAQIDTSEGEQKQFSLEDLKKNEDQKQKQMRESG